MASGGRGLAFFMEVGDDEGEAAETVPFTEAADEELLLEKGLFA